VTIRLSPQKGGSSGMKDDENKADKTSFAIVGFVCGVLTVILLLFAMKGC